jgi:hypothetical protein
VITNAELICLSVGVIQEYPRANSNGERERGRDPNTTIGTYAKTLNFVHKVVRYFLLELNFAITLQAQGE